MTALGCAAIYARFSTGRQSDLSIDDQVRKCREYASAHGLTVRGEHIYADEAMSGVGSESPGAEAHDGRGLVGGASVRGHRRGRYVEAESLDRRSSFVVPPLDLCGNSARRRVPGD